MKKLFLTLAVALLMTTSTYAATLQLTAPDGGESWPLDTLKFPYRNWPRDTLVGSTFDKRKGPLRELQEWASFLSYFLVGKFTQPLLPLSPLRLLMEPLLRYTLLPKALMVCTWRDRFPQESGVT